MWRIWSCIEMIKELKNSKSAGDKIPKEFAQQNYDRGISHAAFTVAHELCHTSTGYLTGFLRPRMPENVAAGGMGTPGTNGETVKYAVPIKMTLHLLGIK